MKVRRTLLISDSPKGVTLELVASYGGYEAYRRKLDLTPGEDIIIHLEHETQETE